MDDFQQSHLHEAIRRVIALYAQHLDSGRLKDWIGLFREGAHFRFSGENFTGRPGIFEEIDGMQPPPERPVKHVCLVPVDLAACPAF